MRQDSISLAKKKKEKKSQKQKMGDFQMDRVNTAAVHRCKSTSTPTEKYEKKEKKKALHAAYLLHQE